MSAGAHSQARDETRRPPCDDQESTVACYVVVDIITFIFHFKLVTQCVILITVFAIPTSPSIHQRLPIHQSANPKTHPSNPTHPPTKPVHIRCGSSSRRRRYTALQPSRRATYRPLTQQSRRGSTSSSSTRPSFPLASTQRMRTR